MNYDLLDILIAIIGIIISILIGSKIYNYYINYINNKQSNINKNYGVVKQKASGKYAVNVGGNLGQQNINDGRK